ncbi:MAG: peptidylprolyl isomerase, partial [Candidatus Falkowbacteria bacterium]|nr:peptidylprolyl isomerase [Candidatus Falkowbacteria bacterium]
MKESLLERVINPSVRGKIWRLLAVIIVLVIITGLIDAGKYYNHGVNWLSAKTGNSINLPKMKEIPFRLGLDISGGTQLTYRTDMKNIAVTDQSNAIEGARDVIERRVNVFGISEPVVQTSVSGGEYKIIVELAGVKDVKEAIKMIGETPLLEFKEQADKTKDLTTDEKTKIDNYNQEVESKAQNVLGKLLSGGNFDALAKEYTEESDLKDKSGNLGWIVEKDNPVIISIVSNFKAGDYTKELVKEADSFQIIKLI